MRSYNPKYQLKIKQTLTVKPDEFYMHVTPRKERSAETILGKGAERAKEQARKMGQSTELRNGDENIGLSIYYGVSSRITSQLEIKHRLTIIGSNSGTCKALATKMADTAEQRGLNTELLDLNAVAAGDLPSDRPIAIVTTSYEGQVSANHRYMIRS